MERSNDAIFGYDRHPHLAKLLAVLELSKMFIDLVRRFNFTLANPLEVLGRFL